MLPQESMPKSVLYEKASEAELEGDAQSPRSCEWLLCDTRRLAGQIQHRSDAA